jgi:hypothetical protein
MFFIMLIAGGLAVKNGQLVFPVVPAQVGIHTASARLTGL